MVSPCGGFPSIKKLTTSKFNLTRARTGGGHIAARGRHALRHYSSRFVFGICLKVFVTNESASKLLCIIASSLSNPFISHRRGGCRGPAASWPEWRCRDSHQPAGLRRPQQPPQVRQPGRHRKLEAMLYEVCARVNPQVLTIINPICRVGDQILSINGRSLINESSNMVRVRMERYSLEIVTGMCCLDFFKS